MITHKQSISFSPERVSNANRLDVIRIAAENAKTMITAQTDKLKADQEAQALSVLEQLQREKDNLDFHLRPQLRREDEEDSDLQSRPHSYDPIPVRHETLEPGTVIQSQVDVYQQAKEQRIAEARKLTEQAGLN